MAISRLLLALTYTPEDTSLWAGHFKVMDGGLITTAVSTWIDSQSPEVL